MDSKSVEPVSLCVGQAVLNRVAPSLWCSFFNFLNLILNLKLFILIIVGVSVSVRDMDAGTMMPRTWLRMTCGVSSLLKPFGRFGALNSLSCLHVKCFYMPSYFPVLTLFFLWRTEVFLRTCFYAGLIDSIITNSFLSRRTANNKDL